MRYYRVKKDSDQLPHGIRFKRSFFVGGELYTAREVEKSGHGPKFIETHLIPLELRPKDTYFFFGARFQKPSNH